METPNTRSLSRAFLSRGVPRRELLRVLQTFNAGAEAFRDESKRHED
jgi:hypothetical protein